MGQLCFITAATTAVSLLMMCRSGPSRAVESFAQQIRVAVVPGVLLDHVDVDPAQVHLEVTVRMEEGLVQSPVPGCFPGEFNLPYEDGEVLLGIGCTGVIELPVGIGLAGIQEADLLSRDAAAKPSALHLRICRTSPSSDRLEGSTVRCRNYSAARPLHLLSSDWR
jgi:hypothetical protein